MGELCLPQSNWVCMAVTAERAGHAPAHCLERLQAAMSCYKMSQDLGTCQLLEVFNVQLNQGLSMPPALEQGPQPAQCGKHVCM